MEIQHTAGWTSSRPMKRYDLSTQEDVFRIALEKRGLIPAENDRTDMRAKKCRFCNSISGFSDSICRGCKRPLDRKQIVEELKTGEQADDLRVQVKELTEQVEKIKEAFLPIAAREIREGQSSGYAQGRAQRSHSGGY